MENLKEIDLLLMAVPEDIHDNAWVQTAIKMLRDIAEITKENEPVDKPACPYCSSDNEAVRETYFDQTCDGCVARMPHNKTLPLPSTEQIENRVAEACAELCDSLYITENAAYEIRAGKWKEFIK